MSWMMAATGKDVTMGGIAVVVGVGGASVKVGEGVGVSVGGIVVGVCVGGRAVGVSVDGSGVVVGGGAVGARAMGVGVGVVESKRKSPTPKTTVPITNANARVYFPTGGILMAEISKPPPNNPSKRNNAPIMSKIPSFV